MSCAAMLSRVEDIVFDPEGCYSVNKDVGPEFPQRFNQ
jgi:hypothetical protein